MKTIFALVVALLASGSADADTHYGIVSAARSSPRAEARINLSSAQPTGVVFRVFAPNGERWDALDTNFDLFVTSAASSVPEIQNLFAAAGGESVLVYGADLGGVSSTAVLEQSSPDGKVLVGLPPLEAAWGTGFHIPIGDLHDGVVVLVGNPGSAPAGVIMRYGSGADEEAGTVASKGVLAIPVTRANTLLKVKSPDTTKRLIVNLVVDTGKTTEITFISPIDPGQ